MDGVRRLEKKKLEAELESDVFSVFEGDNSMESQHDETVSKSPIKERKSFLDKLTERVKDFLDNAE
jgi:cell division protein FtsA